MSNRDNIVFIILHVIAWIIFVGLSIEAGALIVNFVVSLYRPELVANLYQKLDLSDLYQNGSWNYYQVYSFIMVIALVKAIMFYVVVRLMHKMELSQPFTFYVSDQINLISYCTFSIGILSVIARQVVKNIEKSGLISNKVEPFWGDAQAYILMAAVIYVIAVIFKKGVEIQNENELTV